MRFIAGKITSRARSAMTLALSVTLSPVMAQSLPLAGYRISTPGLTGAPYQNTASGLVRNDVVTQLNDAGMLAGSTSRYNAIGTSLGADSWRFDGAGTLQIGLIGTDYQYTNPGSGGGIIRNSNVYGLNASGQVSGSSKRYNSAGGALGQNTWWFDGNTTQAIGLSGTDYEYAFGGSGGGTYHEDAAGKINDSAQVAGYTKRYNTLGTAIGQDAWRFSGSSSTFIGLSGTDYEYAYSGSGGGTFRKSVAIALNNSGDVLGQSDRYNSAGQSLGTDPWLYNGSTSSPLGLSGSQYQYTYPGPGGGTFRQSFAFQMNAASNVAGTSNRYNSLGASLGRDSFRYNGSHVQIGLIGSGYEYAYPGAGGGTYRQSDVTQMNASGQVLGASARFNSTGGDLGQDAWLYDGTSSQMISLSGSDYEYAFAGPAGGTVRSGFAEQLNSTGQARGYNYRYNSAGAFLGQDAWFASGGSTQMVGLSGTNYQYAFTGPGGGNFRQANTIDLNSSGQMVGNTYRFDASGNSLGLAGWFFDSMTSITSPLEFSFRSSDNFSYTQPALVTDQGVVLGSYQLFSGNTSIGLRAFWWSKTNGFFDLGNIVNETLPANGWQSLANVYGSTIPGGAGSVSGSSPRFIVGSGAIASQTGGTSAYLLTAANGGNWLNATNANNAFATNANWSSTVAPTNLDSATFSIASTYAVVVAVSSSVKTMSVTSGDVDFQLQGSATLGAQSLSINAATMRLSGTSVVVVDSLSLTGGAVLDLKESDLIVRTSGARDAIWNAILSGQNGLDGNGLTRWDGPGIISSEARSRNVSASTPLYALGVIRNGDLNDLLGPGHSYTTFDGQPVGLEDILVKFTYGGDTDLDGSITFSDYVNIDSAYGGTAPNLGWVSGDFDKDGQITFSDYVAIDTAYAFQTGALSQSLMAQRLQMFGPEYVSQLQANWAALNSVPEPGCVALCAISGIALLRRRR